MGKRSNLDDFHLQRRGGKGLKCYKITEKTGDVVGVKAVTDEHEIMLITTGGVVIQIRMDEINVIGRITSGVKLMNLEKGVKVAGIAKVREKVSDGEHEIDDIDEAIANQPESTESDYEDDEEEDEEVTLPKEDEEEDS